MLHNRTLKLFSLFFLSIFFTACSIPTVVQKTENKTVPTRYDSSADTLNTAKVKWKGFFTDPYLVALIDTALKNNQELNIVIQEISIAKNEIRARKGQYLPFVNIGAGAVADKPGKFTRQGAIDESLEIMPDKKIPSPLSNFSVSANASWELDVWKKLRNYKKAAVFRYLATDAGKNYVVTNLIAEIANSYYELMAYDNQLEILKKNIEIQQNALQIVKLEKEAAKVTELAVRKFEAEVFKNQSRLYYISQQIIETENKLNFLVGKISKPILRNSQNFTELMLDTIHAGIPSQLLANRPDIKQAEQELAAAKLDVKVAKAKFYPSFMITAGIGYEAFNPQYLLNTPESMLYYFGGGLIAPLINRNALKADYLSANAKQIQAVYNYERAILRGYLEVANQLSNISNLEKSYNLKTSQVQALTQSIDISTGLFKSARANYIEVLLTQRDALEAKFELIETKKLQLNAKVNIYKALGGGWN